MIGQSPHAKLWLGVTPHYRQTVTFLYRVGIDDIPNFFQIIPKIRLLLYNKIIPQLQGMQEKL